MKKETPLKGLRCLFCNPRLYPYDLRGEAHAPGRWKSERAMNFGLLVAASYIKKLGAEVVIADFEETPGSVEDHIKRFTPHMVGVGNISCYGFLGTLDIIKRVKSVDRGILTVVGGQNARLSAENFISAKTPPDVLIMGAGEAALEHIGRALLDARPMTEVPGSRRVPAKGLGIVVVQGEPVPLSQSAFLCYELYPSYRTFFPLVEESRGCPCQCNFCGNVGHGVTRPLYQRKDPELLAKEIEHAYRAWRPTKNFPCVLMCASFGNYAAQTKEFLRLIRKKDLGVKFLAAMRADAPWQAYSGEMHGLFDQVHFGLESASPEILARMQKTRNPAAYLDSASRGIRYMHAQGIHVACNFILGYPGENRRSLQQTLQFLLAHGDSIDSLWGGACVEYPGCRISEKMGEWGAAFGTKRRVISPFCDQLNAYPLDPSHDFSFEQMASTSLLLMKLFNARDKFYEHYRWYPGPNPQKKDPLAFYPEEAFFKLMSEGTDPKDMAFTEVGK